MKILTKPWFILLMLLHSLPTATYAQKEEKDTTENYWTSPQGEALHKLNHPSYIYGTWSGIWGHQFPHFHMGAGHIFEDAIGVEFGLGPVFEKGLSEDPIDDFDYKNPSDQKGFFLRSGVNFYFPSNNKPRRHALTLDLGYTYSKGQAENRFYHVSYDPNDDFCLFFCPPTQEEPSIIHQYTKVDQRIVLSMAYTLELHITKRFSLDFQNGIGQAWHKHIVKDPPRPNWGPRVSGFLFSSYVAKPTETSLYFYFLSRARITWRF